MSGPDPMAPIIPKPGTVKAFPSQAAFETWLLWALAAPETHLSCVHIRKDLEDVGGV